MNPTSQEDSLRLQTSGDGLLKASRTVGAEKERRIKKMGLRTAPTRHAGPAKVPSSLHRVGSVRRLGSPCLWDRDQIAGETNCCIVQAISKDILVRSARFLCEVETSWCMSCCPTTAQRDDVAVAEFEKYLRVRDIHGLEELFNHGPNELGHLCIQYLRTCFGSGTLGPRQAGTLISGLRRYVLLSKSCGGDLEAYQRVFRTEVGPSPSRLSSEH